METPKFEEFSVIKNTINKSLGIVLKEVGDNITIHPAKGGERMTFKAQYIEPASEKESLTLKNLIEELKKEEKEKSKKGSKKIIDPELIRYEFDKFLKHIAVRHAKSVEAFKIFWHEILNITGYFPGKTWEMKSSSTSNPCPVIKVCNQATQKWVYCLSLMAGWGLRMEIKKEFLPKECEQLFPIDNAMFGAGKAVEISYADFGEEKRRPYLDCVKIICKQSSKPN